MNAFPSSRNSLKNFLLLRFVFVFLISILGVSLYLKQKWPYPLPNFVYFLCWLSVVYLTTGIFWIIWRKEKFRFLSLLAIAWDLFLITILIYITGGANSFFCNLYIFIIILAALLFRKRGALLTAASAFILYGTLIDLEYFKIIPTLGETVGDDVLFTLLINFSAFFAIAFLISLLLERLEKSRKKLRSLEALHKCVLESLQTGVITLDKENRILYLNKAAEFILGYKSESLIKQPINKLFSHAEITPGQRKSFSFVKPNGKLIYLGLGVSSLTDEMGEYVGKVIIFQDITHLKRVEKLSLLNELASHLAHDIKTPLTSISGCLQMLRKENISLENKTLIELALEETNRLNALISDYLSYARPTKEREKVDISQLIKETITLFKGSLGDKKITVDTTLLEKTYVRGNKEEIRQLFWNLFVNSKEAMPNRGMIKVIMEKEQNMIKIMVQDTGRGIPKEIQDRIFEPFFTTKPQGSGLGLAIVHKIVNEHEGEIEVENQPEKGASINLYFPLISSSH